MWQYRKTNKLTKKLASSVFRSSPIKAQSRRRKVHSKQNQQQQQRQ